MKIGLFTKTRNIRFISARQRVQRKIEILEGRLAAVALEGRYDNLIVTFIDETTEFFKIIQKCRNDDIYQVNVGYDYSKRLVVRG